MTFSSGAKLIYWDEDRAKRDYEALQHEPKPQDRPIKLERVDPTTNAVLDAMS